MREGLETEEQVSERLEGLRVRLMRAEKEGDKGFVEKLTIELGLCELVLNKHSVISKEGGILRKEKEKGLINGITLMA